MFLPTENRTLCPNGQKKPMFGVVLLYMYLLSKISHIFKPNQAPIGF